MKGWIKLHRVLTEKSIWLESSPEQKTILITLLMMANHQGKEWEWMGESYKAEPGQFVTSLPSIVKKCGKGITTQNIRTALKRFEKYDFLTDESTNKNRLITIINWDVYQSTEKEVVNQVENQGLTEVEKSTAKLTGGNVVTNPVVPDNKSNFGLVVNSQTNSRLTGNQQATNRQLTANKNVKNVKNDKNDKKVINNSPKQAYDESSIYFKLANALYQKILENNPNHKQPDLQKWSNDVRLMMERDKRTEEQIIYTIKWCQNNEFWRSNILSISKLREKFDQLIIQIKSDRNKPIEKPIYKGSESYGKSDGGSVKKDGNVRLFK